MRAPVLLAVVTLCACADTVPPPVPPSSAPVRASVSFDDDVAFMRAHAPVEVLASASGGVVAVSARWQGRVMTSAVEPRGASLGFVHRAFIEGGKTGTAFDNYGGEDRFWLGPEGGQFGLYFPPGAPFNIATWQTPHAMQEGEWEVRSRDASHVTFAKTMHVESWSRSAFDVAVERTVRVLGPDEVRARFGVAPPPSARWVAFETDNAVTNAGSRPWTRETGLLSIWILGMYAPARDARVVVPFDPAGSGPVVNDAYFGKIPPERLRVHDRFVELVADGERRGKIGVPPPRAKETLGSFVPGARLLTLVRYARPAKVADGYVNSAWEQQREPYGGDVVNAYNDGPTEPGKPSLGGFYELETSSPALALAPGQTAHHVHTTLHVVADSAELETLAKAVLGVSLGELGR